MSNSLDQKILDDIKAALSQCDKAELIDLFAHIYKLYVIEDVPIFRQTVSGSGREPDRDKEMALQLLAEIKNRYLLPELDGVSVEKGRLKFEREICAPGQDSHQTESRPASASSAVGSTSRPGGPETTPAQQSKPESRPPEEEIKRFRLLEFD